MSENPYESPHQQGAEGRKKGFRLAAPAVVLGLAACVLLFAIQVVPLGRRGGREVARRNQCMNQLKQLALALDAYQQHHGAYPPAYTTDAEGNRLHSWRTLLLPFLEQAELYESIDLTKPWDDPANAAPREVEVWCFQCPSDWNDERLTNYLGVVGPGAFFAGAEPRTPADIDDGAARTIAIVDVDSDRAVHWMSPNDITIDEALAYGPDSPWNHPGVVQAAFVDGHVRAIPLENVRGVFSAALTIAGGEAVAE